jgi:transcriptional regulator with XRE-family HTH domain
MLCKSQRKFAALVGSSQAQIARLEKTNSVPNLALAVAIERVSRRAGFTIFAKEWVKDRHG